MLDLELSGTAAVLENFNPRVEKNGPDKVPAADLKVGVTTSADVLAFFSPTLKAHLFDTEGPRDLAEGMRLRYPHIDYPINLDHELTGAAVAIDYGIGKPMEFADAKINQFRITPHEGGSVTLGFRIQCKPDEKQAGKLFLLQEQAITITVVPPELKELAA